MRRTLAIGAVAVAVLVALVLATSGGGDDGGYRVRAIFMNAFSVIRGEDVKIAGVKVGKIESIDVTTDNRAAVVLKIDKPGFDDFRADAECTIRPQSLIGEKFVECTPTQPRAEGDPQAPPLKRIDEGEGKGEYLLPVSQTSRPVDLDLLNNTLRMPERQRFAILLNELGTGLAGRSEDLRIAVRNANPALKETDKVLALLAAQNTTLRDLARDSDAIFRPLARDRAQVADFVVNANTTAEATAERSSDLELDIQKLPGFLRELGPTMQRLGALSDQFTPVLADLGANASSINTLIKQLGPFSQSATPALISLGDTSVVGRRALVQSKPIIDDLAQLGATAKPLSKNLATLTTSLRDTGGLERALDFVYRSTTATNGYDQFGHYLRAQLLLNQCSSYQVTADAACLSQFTGSGSGSASRATTASTVTAADTAPVTEAVEQSAPASGAADGAQTGLLDYLLGGGG
jgi:phospholipid/cholesterol/gamma-HCH transport system substrate-binding protein